MTPMTSHIEGSKSKYPGTDYCVTNGMSSMVKHFLKKSGATTKFQNHVDNIKITSEDMIEVSTQVDNINNFELIFFKIKGLKIIFFREEIKNCSMQLSLPCQYLKSYNYLV